MGGGGEEHRIRRHGLIWPVASVAATVVGVAAVIWAEAQPVSFGWFAYAPLSDTTFTPDIASDFTPGVVLAVIGLAVLGFWSGLTIDARRKHSATRSRWWATRILVPVGLLLLVIGIVFVIQSALPSDAPFETFIPFSGGPSDTASISSFPDGGSAVVPFELIRWVSGAGLTLVALGLTSLAFWSGRRTSRAR
ncbi:hypothetical protein [Frondihabitans sp. VKM Ac-2883]|uniref:DUF805 domain-containing protein n=1 Tax=Frondihabitans sp. VKM Ac-2883 TaxID=2783823 RepID=UPI00188BCE5A|nr:hypothetical protein [Frondihabitans sp. VKM Ac-2883]MBF4576654.1 hypothetical protein [Frondihabitans sp. VKM Ac-2883]